MRGLFLDLPRTALGALYWAFIIYLLLPLMVMMAVSFKDANFVAFPIGDWTFNWYVTVMQDKQFLDAVVYSIMIAAATTAIATIVGVWIAMLIVAEGLRGQIVIFAIAVLPAIVPGMISAISLRLFVSAIDLPTGTAAIIFGHTVHAVPFVVVMALTRLRSMPGTLVDAARDLGADSLVAFCRVTLPYLGPALFGGMIFCVLTSIDDFVRTFFLGGYRPTLPMLIYAKVQGGMSPEINAMATIVLVVTTAVGMYAEYLTRRTRSR